MATYVKGNNLKEVIASIDENFAKALGQDIYKGDKGDNVETQSLPLRTYGALTSAGQVVFETIFGEDADVTESRVAAVPEYWYLFPAAPLFFVYNEGSTTDYVDYSCMITAWEESADEYKYKKSEVFPTIYYNPTLNSYCWKVNGVKTEIPTFKTANGSGAARLFLIKGDSPFQYWDPTTGSWSYVSEDKEPGDLAYRLGTDETTNLATVQLYTWSGTDWVIVDYDNTVITYDDARMTYIWKTIYDKLGQTYSDEILDANSFKFPDIISAEDGCYHRITAMSNDNRSDLVVGYSQANPDNGKHTAIILDDYEVYTAMPSISLDGTVTLDDSTKLISNGTGVYKHMAYSDLLDEDGNFDIKKLGKYTWVMIDRGIDTVNTYVRYIYLNTAQRDANMTSEYAADPWIGIGQTSNNTMVFEVSYDIANNKILWMKDKWGNEADYDFVETPTFCFCPSSNNPEDINEDSYMVPYYGSSGWFRNNKVIRGNSGKNFRFVTYRAAGADGYELVYPDNVLISSNTVIESQGMLKINTVITSNVKDAYSTTLNMFSDLDVKVLNNSFINSTVKMNVGGASMIMLYNKVTYFVPCLGPSRMKSNTFKNSNVSLNFTREMSHCDIIDSTINHIKALWAMVNSKTVVGEGDVYTRILYNYTPYVSLSDIKSGVTASSPAYGFDMYRIIQCKFNNVYLDNPTAFVTGASDVFGLLNQQTYYISSIILNDMEFNYVSDKRWVEAGGLFVYYDNNVAKRITVMGLLGRPNNDKYGIVSGHLMLGRRYFNDSSPLQCWSDIDYKGHILVGYDYNNSSITSIAVLNAAYASYPSEPQSFNAYLYIRSDTHCVYETDIMDYVIANKT